MKPIALAGPAVEPVSLAEMRSYLRLDGEEEDDLVSALIMAARVTVERHTRIALIRQSWQLVLTAWPRDRAVRLPFYPVLGIEAVRVSEEDRSLSVVAPESYHLRPDDDVPHLVLHEDAAEPRGVPPRIEIDVSCGFGATAGAVPEPLVLAIRRLVAHWFERRGDDPGSSPRPSGSGLPADVAGLIAPFGRPRLA